MNCQSHDGHQHTHGSNCGHVAIEHTGHVDYLHDGHLHHLHEGHVDEHQVDGASACTPAHACGTHPAGHAHGSGCGHEAVPHAGHTDYLVGNHLHHAHGGHCDDHGGVKVTA
jgi:hypothetical protein